MKQRADSSKRTFDVPEPELTPLMRQYREIKQAYQDAILFFRVGDFYEMFFEDAEEASTILEIVLTSRDKNQGNPIPLCGVPYHSATGYIGKLLKAGKTVALCEQVEDPKLAKGLVRREVVRLYTPGTLFDAEFLPTKTSNFLTAITHHPKIEREKNDVWGLAGMDLSTGEFWVSEISGACAELDLFDELTRVDPQELIYPYDLSQDLDSKLRTLKLPRLVAHDSSRFDIKEAFQLLEEQFSNNFPERASWATLTAGIQAAGALLRYLQETQPTLGHNHIQQPYIRHLDREMHLDPITIRNLELIKPTSEGPTLLSILDHTLTSMGGRLIRQWILRPLTDLQSIQARLEAVAELFNDVGTRMSLCRSLKHVHDLERLSSRVSLGTASPRELLGLQQSLTMLPDLQSSLAALHSSLLSSISRTWDNLDDLRSLIAHSISPEAPHSTREGGIIQAGYDPGLDELRHHAREGTKWMAELESRERERTGIDSLKVKFNQVFGYYIEVTKTNLSRVPSDYIRKQTLANAERFTTMELRRLEDQVTSAEQRLKCLEQELFTNICQQVAQATHRMQKMAKAVALLDVISALAEAAALNRYVLPEIDEGGTIRITEGRHPVVEKTRLPGGFIPNDTYLDLDTHRLLLITGPNMAGKSTYIRQVALIVLLAQIGSLVPAKAARIGLVDRIFTRVGASDNLAAGQSTFMVEMTETAAILKAATPRSLILLDEVGRGTSTYDGLSIAWAAAEHIHDRRCLGARTLFATHYHEMTDLENQREGIKNYTVLVKEQHEDVLFLRRIIEGKADRSYGIHVARLAGLPASVIKRAEEVLAQLERSEPAQEALSFPMPDSQASGPFDPTLPPPHEILEEVKQMDLFSMTPIEALNRLADFQRRLESEE